MQSFIVCFLFYESNRENMLKMSKILNYKFLIFLDDKKEKRVCGLVELILCLFLSFSLPAF